ncbi:hypothetical protein SteCoe_18516 [Stentor coeruleus]|uniref:Myb-like DNA-binding domain containing protein n=1 Tax=Stentor coeruleus TaxID=5963 RepID=A0A1R2BWA5_9CILI|nr:hypothetical protein SteCoe_18516 [Stentor coeruleus]
MSWNSALDHALEYWDDVIIDVSAICIKDQAKSNKTLHDLDPKALFPEPRSLDSSELSDSESENTLPIWTNEEDTTLLEEVEKTNHEWEAVAKSFPNSSVKLVKRRWEKLNKNKTKHEWTEEEDKMIVSLYKIHGGNWKKIATYFNGISSSNIKNRFYGCIKRKLENTNKLQDEAEKPKADEVKKDKKEEAEKPLNELTPEEKRLRLQDLYSKMMELEGYIKNAKNQIQEFVSKISTPTSK